MANDAKDQPYDNLLKHLLQNQPDTIIPLLFPELACEVLEEINIERLIPPRRADRVYKTRPEGRDGNEEILHIEFESSANSRMDKRLLVYHALLLEEYRLPINSIIIYPFKISMVKPPLKEMRGDKEILSFDYQTVPLWKQSARRYIERHAVPLYGLLPVMEEVNEELLLQAIEEMIQWYGDDQAHLRDELLCFTVMLRRAQPLPEAEMLRIARRVHMFDPLLEEDPWVKEKVEKGKAEGLVEGKAEGLVEGKAEGLVEGKAEGLVEGRAEGLVKGRAEGLVEGRAEGLKALRNTLSNIVEHRFPRLIELAEEKGTEIEQSEALNILVVQVSVAVDEQVARSLLEQ